MVWVIAMFIFLNVTIVGFVTGVFVTIFVILSIVPLAFAYLLFIAVWV
jgi:hypothetical protein